MAGKNNTSSIKVKDKKKSSYQHSPSEEETSRFKSKFSEYNPSEEDIISYPYVVSSYYLDGKYVNFEYNTYTYITKVRYDLIKILRMLQQEEQKKEELFIEDFIKIYKSIGDENSNLYKELRECKSISQKIDLIEKYELGYIDATKNIRDQVKDLQNKWNDYSNEAYKKIGFSESPDNFFKTMIDKINESLEKKLEIGDLSIEQITNQIIIQMNDKTGEAYKKYAEYLELIKKALQDNLGASKFGKYYTASINQIKRNKKDFLKVANITKNKDRSITKIIFDHLIGILNGLPSEVFLTQNRTGFLTGRINQVKRTLLNPNLTNQNNEEMESIAIKSDVIQLFSVNVTGNFIKINDNLDELSGLSSGKALLEQLDEIGEKFSKMHIVRISSKDYFSSKKEATLNNEASLNKMLYPFYDIGENINSLKRPMQELIFAIVNTGPFAIYSKDLSKIKDYIYNVCVVYMFEDYVNIFKRVVEKTGSNINDIHLYFINGYFYAISDILTQLISYIENSNNDKIININLKPTLLNEFVVAHGEGEERWNNVRNNTLKHGSLGLHLKYQTLSELFSKY